MEDNQAQLDRKLKSTPCACIEGGGWVLSPGGTSQRPHTQLDALCTAHEHRCAPGSKFILVKEKDEWETENKTTA